MEGVVTTGTINRAKLQSNHHHQQTNIQFFYRPDALPENIKYLHISYSIESIDFIVPLLFNHDSQGLGLGVGLRGHVHGNLSLAHYAFGPAGFGLDSQIFVNH